MKRLIFALMALICIRPAGAQIIVEPPAMRPLPTAVQNLSDEEYAAWAIWQNALTRRRVDGYYGVRWLTSPASEVTTSLRGSATRSTYGTYGKGRRSGFTVNNYSRCGTINRRDYLNYYVNPDYVGPGPATYYNPFVRVEAGLGTPDYENLFIQTDEGPITIADFIRAEGPLGIQD